MPTNIEYNYRSSKSLLNKGTGFLSGYTHSLNPYKELGMENWHQPTAYRVVYERLKSYFSEEQLFISQRDYEP